MKYLLGFLASIVLIVLVFILVLRGFSHSGSQKPKDQIVLAQHVATSMQVQLTVDGPITADQNHVGYRITVDRSQSKIETYQGYQNNVTQTKAYTNNQEGYEQFLRALDLAGFANGDTKSKATDEKGYCATGSRMIYEVIGNSTAPNSRFWSTTCKQGNFKGNPTNIRVLFQKQIPDFGPVTSKLGI